MSESFDPYHVWLGIPPESRPPTHYELLGISPDEREKAVIEAAVLRQSGYVRNFQIGKYAKEAARILNEIGAAKGCLLDPAKRAKYDAELRAIQPATAPVAYQVAPATALPAPSGIESVMPELSPLASDLLSASFGASPPLVGTRQMPRGLRGAMLRKPSRLSWQPLAGFVIGVALTLVVVALRPWHFTVEPADSAPVTGIVHLQSTTVPPTTTPEPPSPEPPTPEPLSADAPAAPSPSSEIRPRVLQVKTQTYSWPSDVARYEDDAFYVAQGGEHGWAAVGYELQDAMHVRLRLDDVGTLRPIDGNFFAGFCVDYHTPHGYSHRVALCIGSLAEKRAPRASDFGAHLLPDRHIDLTQQFAFNEQKYLEWNADVAAISTRDGAALSHWQTHGRHEGRRAQFGETEIHDLNLEDWAPSDWDGRRRFRLSLT